jgi:hypothetical protein
MPLVSVLFDVCAIHSKCCNILACLTLAIYLSSLIIGIEWIPIFNGHALYFIAYSLFADFSE